MPAMKADLIERRYQVVILGVVKFKTEKEKWSQQAQFSKRLLMGVGVGTIVCGVLQEKSYDIGELSIRKKL